MYDGQPTPINIDQTVLAEQCPAAIGVGTTFTVRLPLEEHE